MPSNTNLTAKERILAEISTLGPLGKKLPAPGTWGSLAGVVFYYFAFQKTGIAAEGNSLQFFIFAALLVVCAIPICECGEKFFGKTDPGEVNFDEFSVMPVCFAGLGNAIGCGWTALCWLAAGFAIFRVVDIAKPWKIKDLQRLKGGLGVVADDFAAAVVTCACLNVAKLVLSA
ncbi:MAG: phosphatidylglycerophosphatase A [Opitutae bacterium]|nr:phosphatidylglycerophosphatase A [Opitutae bacterium]